MTVFQSLAIAMIALLLVREAVDIARGRRPYRFRLLRASMWFSAGIAIAFPNLIQVVAGFLGIGRGADVVLYSFVLAFLATAFFLYAQLLRQQQQITQLVRHLAIREARHSTSDPPPSEGGEAGEMGKWGES